MQTVKNIRVRTATLMDWLSVKSNLIRVAVILLVAVAAGALFYFLGSEQPATDLALSKWALATVGATFGTLIGACVVFSTLDFVQVYIKHETERIRLMREIAPPSDDLILLRQILAHRVVWLLVSIPNPLWLWIAWVVFSDDLRMMKAGRTLRAKE